MRLYHRTPDDQRSACLRAVFDANSGRVELALDRLADILEEGPSGDELIAAVLYTKGLILRDFLGKGIEARELFKRAYALNSKHAFAVINATYLARNEAEMRKWIGIFRAVVPAEEQRAHQFVTVCVEALDSGVSFFGFVHNWAVDEAENGRLGSACAHMEIALTLLGKLDPPPLDPDEAKTRRWRAQRLRLLDEQAANARAASWEHFPAGERLALREALAELERAIALDPWDAELWNLKGAWCQMLGRLHDALPALEEAIRLRPGTYVKPHINKASVLLELNQDDSALAAAEEALREARAAGDAADEDNADRLLKRAAAPRRTPQPDDLRGIAERMLLGALILADKERGEHAEQDRLRQQVAAPPLTVAQELAQLAEKLGKEDALVIGGFFNRARKLAGRPSVDYVPIVAELLSDFCPERAFNVISRMPRIQDYLPGPLPGIENVAQVAHDRCLHAALYVAAHSEGVRRRDAARLLALVFLGALDGNMIRAAYREGILEIASAAPPPMSQLDNILREELARTNPFLPRLTADQPPLTDDERRRGERVYREHFPGGRSKERAGGGCASVFIGFGLILAIAIMRVTVVMH
jgi:tetratricopeptide (TPR) repeat protein